MTVFTLMNINNGFEMCLFPFEHGEREELNPGSQSSLVLRGPHPWGWGTWPQNQPPAGGPRTELGPGCMWPRQTNKMACPPRRKLPTAAQSQGWERGPRLGVTQVHVSVTHWSPSGRGPRAGLHTAFPEVATPCPGTCPPVALGAGMGQGRQPPTPGDGPVLSGLDLASGRHLEKRRGNSPQCRLVSWSLSGCFVKAPGLKTNRSALPQRRTPSKKGRLGDTLRDGSSRRGPFPWMEGD